MRVAKGTTFQVRIPNTQHVAGKGSITEKAEFLFNLLCANGVTTDYCLQIQSYHDTAEPFATFDAYVRYYKVVIQAVELGHEKAAEVL